MNRSKMRAATLLLAAALLLPVSGCSSILNGDTISVSAHNEPSASPSSGVLEASTYDEIKSNLLSLIFVHEPKGIFRVNFNYEGDVQNDVNRACSELPRTDPIGSYAVAEMVGTVKQIVSYYEVEVNFAYTDVTKEQLESIITVSTPDDLDYTLQFMLSEYAPSVAFLASGLELTEADALARIDRLYYDNPRDIVLMPVTTVAFYPRFGGDDRVVEYTFGYRHEATTLEKMEQSLKDSVSTIADIPLGEADVQILLTLTQRLMEKTEYESETAAGGDYTNQNQYTTAYSALINGEAVSEGYAMAFKALCDEAGIGCTVVIGQYDGMIHAWNLVELDGAYYHIDVSICDQNSLDAAFLKNDDFMRSDYSWDTDSYPVADGPLTDDSTPSGTTATAVTVQSGPPAGTPASEAPAPETPTPGSPSPETPASGSPSPGTPTPGPSADASPKPSVTDAQAD